MRWLVFFLFVFNGLVFMWFSFQEHDRQQLTVSESEMFDFSSVRRIELLSELPESDRLGRDVRKEAVSRQVFDAQGNTCALIGPFPEVISAKQAKSRLEERALSSRTVLVLKELPAINWIYIAPQSDRKKALALLRDLQSKNIDSFLIADGEYENGISLGFFSSLESARLVLAERLEQGYPVVLAEKKREQKTYWLAFNADVTPKLDDAVISGLEEDNFAVNKQEKACADIALLPVIE